MIINNLLIYNPEHKVDNLIIFIPNNNLITNKIKIYLFNHHNQMNNKVSLQISRIKKCLLITIHRTWKIEIFRIIRQAVNIVHKLIKFKILIIIQ